MKTSKFFSLNWGIVFALVFLLLPSVSFAATDVYYSVGTNTSDLKNGPTNITITNGVAVFNVSQADKVGVGDKVTYEGNISYISGRINSSAYNVITAKGEVPANITDQIVYNITRAFNSLDDAVDAADGGVCANDSSHLNTSNLTEGNYTLNIACYGDGADTTAVTVDGWTTSVDNYIKIYTPVNSSEVGVSQRHDGKWNDGKYRLVTWAADNAGLITINEDYVRVEGLQLDKTNSHNQNIAVVSGATGEIHIAHNIIRSIGGRGINLGGANGAVVKIWNNILYGIGIVHNFGTAGNIYIIYSNTLANSIGMGISLKDSGGDVSLYLKNNLIQNASGLCYDISSFATYVHNNNLADDTSSPDNSYDNKAVVFVDGDNDDFHLASTDVNAINAGANLSSDGNLSFTDDLDGEIRAGTWDIGADEYNVSYPYTIVTLESPTDNYRTIKSSITFNCSASDNSNLENITLWGDWSGWHANETKNISGTSNSTTFTKTLPEGTYIWNCIAYDNDSNSDWGDSNCTLTVDSTAPNVTSISALPNPQGLGENVTITVNITDNVEVNTVLVGIAPPDGTEINYTMSNQTTIYIYNYLNWTNGTYSYTIYANDSSGNLNNSESGTFELYSDVYLHVKTLKDVYGANEIVNITDPFEFDLGEVVVSELDEENSDGFFSSVLDFFSGLFGGVFIVTRISADNIENISENAISIADVSGQNLGVQDFAVIFEEDFESWIGQKVPPIGKYMDTDTSECVNAGISTTHIHSGSYSLAACITDGSYYRAAISEQSSDTWIWLTTWYYFPSDFSPDCGRVHLTGMNYNNHYMQVDMRTGVGAHLIDVTWNDNRNELDTAVPYTSLQGKWSKVQLGYQFSTKAFELWVDDVQKHSAIENELDGTEVTVNVMIRTHAIQGCSEDGYWYYDDISVVAGDRPTDDTTPPTYSNPSPTGTLATGTTTTNISLTTNINATCRYSNVSGTNYTDMEFNFTNTNSTNHSTLVTDLENNHTYIYYIRCNSTDGYYNENDWNITFSVGDGHKADTNFDGLIDMPELMAFIARWKADSNDVSKAEVEEARNIWYGGGGY